MPGLFGGGETLKPLAHIPDSNHSFQVPAHARVGDDVYLAYYIEPTDDDWATDLSRDPGGHMTGQPHAVIRFRKAVYFSSEMYEDDTIEEHRLADEGLRPFCQVQVERSELVETLMERHAKSAIKQHSYPASLSHFIFAMHGYVFEIVAAGFDLHRERGSILASLEHVVRTTLAEKQEIPAPHMLDGTVMAERSR